ncbi:MAG TPA: NAD-dependent epimerase/dehydratase family protein [Stellaceae bacterium]|nr:NAD-dependent epimerase/dehydratase family protein [Stellaceae bacterium]
MRILVLGGTGSIGAPVVRELVGRGHAVTALARSTESARRLAELGATPIVGGDIRAPETWLGAVAGAEAVIHAALDFTSDMGPIEDRLLHALLPALAAQRRPVRFVYTGGCWLYGATGSRTATERTPFDPLPAFAWMVPNLRRVLGSGEVAGVVIHPAMVYEIVGGVFTRFAEDARRRNAVRVVAGEDVRWSLVHRDDLATLYALAVERARPGSSYNGVAVEGLAVGRIARAIARRFKTPSAIPEIMTVEEIAAEHGEWARGYALDQRLSGDKARHELGWTPCHLDPEAEIGRLEDAQSSSTSTG